MGSQGGGTYIQGEAIETGGLQRVQRDVGGRIPVESYDDSTWEGGGDTAAMEHTSRSDQNPDLQGVLWLPSLNPASSGGPV